MSREETTQFDRLVEQAQQGNQEAFEAIYRQTYRLVYFHAKAVTKSEEEALDLVQDTFLAAYRGLKRLQDVRNFRKWITRIVFNLGCKKLRGNHEVLLGEEEQDEIFEALPERDEARLPEESLDRKETVKIIRDVIEGLPVLQKSAVVAYYMDEMGIGEIARLAQCSEGTIKSRLNYARKAMKESILRKEREMGCRLHVVTGPVVVLALRQMFTGMAVSPQKMALVWGMIQPQLGAVQAASAGAGSAGAAAESYGAAEAAGTAQAGGAGAAQAGSAGGTGAAASAAAESYGAAGAAAGGFGAKTAAAAASAAVKGGIAAAHVKVAAAAVSTVLAVTVAGAAGGGYIAYRQHQEAVAQAESQTEIPASEPGSDGGEAETAAAETTAAETEAETAKAGWVAFEEGWKYRAEDGSYLKSQWKEDGGEWYYLTGDEWLQMEDFRLGYQIFTLSDTGSLAQVAYEGPVWNNGDGRIDRASFYTEDAVYYSAYEEGIHVSDLDGGNDKKLCDIDAEYLLVDGDWIYFSTYRVLYRMKTDGTQLEQINNDQWIFVNSMAVEDGVLYMNTIDTGPGDADHTWGEIYEVHWDTKTYRELPVQLEVSQIYKQMQAEDGWLYFLVDSPRFSADPFYGMLVRMSVEDSTIEWISEEGIDAFFACENTAFCTKGGQTIRYSIAQQAEESRQTAEQFEQNPEQVYQEYLTNVLIPQYGQATEFSKQYYYHRTPALYDNERYVAKPDPESAGAVQQGILRSYIDDLDGDGEKEMAVLRVGFRERERTPFESEAPYAALMLDVYEMQHGRMSYGGTSELSAIGPSRNDSSQTIVYIKHYDGKCALLCCHTSTHYDFAAESTVLYEMTFVSFDTGEQGIYLSSQTECEYGTAFEMNQLDEISKNYGFTDNWWTWDEEDGTSVLQVSSQEPDCEVIFREAAGMGARQGGYNTISGYSAVQEMEELGNFEDHPVYWSMDVNPVQEAPGATG